MNIRAELFQGSKDDAYGRIVASLSVLGSAEVPVLQAVVLNDGSVPHVEYDQPRQLSLSEAQNFHRRQQRFFDAVERLRQSAIQNGTAAA